MNERERQFEANEELMSKIEKQYERLGVKDLHWNDMKEPYICLSGSMPLTQEGKIVYVPVEALFTIYYDADGFADEEEMTYQLETELAHITLFNEENSII